MAGNNEGGVMAAPIAYCETREYGPCHACVTALCLYHFAATHVKGLPRGGFELPTFGLKDGLANHNAKRASSLRGAG